MKSATALLLLPSLFWLSGCSAIDEKISSYHLDKALAAARSGRLTPAAADQAFSLVEKAAKRRPSSERTVDVLEQLSAAAARAGCANAPDLESAALRKITALAPDNWRAWQALISYMAARRDIAGLAEAALAAGKSAEKASSPPGKYGALLTQVNATATAVPLLRETAVRNSSGSAAALFEGISLYASAANRVVELSAALAEMNKEHPDLRAAVHPVLIAAAEAAAEAALREREEISRAGAFAALAEKEKAFREAAELTVRGRAALAVREYRSARGSFSAAAARWPAFCDARLGLAEAELGEGKALAAAGSEKEAARLLRSAYAGLGALLADPAAGSGLPFIKKADFLGPAYALKAEAIAALRSAGAAGKGRARARLEREYKAALEEAGRLGAAAAHGGELLAGRPAADWRHSPVSVPRKGGERPR